MSIFGSERESMSGALKNPNALRESFIFEHMSNKDDVTITKFITSREAKVMCEEGLISVDMLDRLENQKSASQLNGLMICHMAMESDDPQFQALVAARAEERRIMNDLIEKYGKEAETLTETYKDQFIKRGLPTEFR